MDRFSRQGGGLVATALVAAHRLGASARFIGKVANDSLGKEILDQLKEEGVDPTCTVVVSGKETRFAIILVDAHSGQRSIIWTPGTVEPLKWEEIDSSIITRCKLLHIDEYEMQAVIPAAQAARAAGIFVSLDAETVEENTPELLQSVNLVIGSEEFGRRFTGQSDPERAARFLREQGPQIAGVTLGSQGSVFCDESESFYQEAFSVDVVDTTGAGDVFHGAFAFGILQGWTSRTCALLASATSALKCRGLGGREAIPDLSSVREFLHERNHLLPE